MDRNDTYFVSGNIKADEIKFDEVLHVDASFDLLKRKIKIGNRDALIYFINGFCKDDIMEKLQEFFAGLKPSDMQGNANDFIESHFPYLQVEVYSDRNNIITSIMSGVLCLLIDGYTQAVVIDLREYPGRDIQEPEKYKVLRGSRDGFVETLILNTALIRRRIRNPEYICEIIRAGNSSRTDIAICYMNDRVNKDLLCRIKKQIKDIDADALSMNQQSLAECIFKGSWFNPFPKFRYTERPDTVAASVLEGQIAILVDNSPAAMLLPTTIFDVIEEADDYYFPPITGTYLRLARASITVLSLFLTPLYLLYANHPEWLPDWLMFTKIQGNVFVPVFWQLMLLELAIDGLKLAAINTPSTLNTPLSLIAAIVIGEFSVNTGWFAEQTMLYMAVVAIANFTHENYELAYSIKFLRLIMLLKRSLLDMKR